ncbi:MAG TPA: hypothetical protein VGM97_20585 [Steroidobacteraceae bacterium]
MLNPCHWVVVRGALTVVAAVALSLGHAQPVQAQSFTFNPNDIVVSVLGNGSNTGTYADGQAAPLTLFQYALNGTSSATAAGTLTLPQTSTAGGNSAFSSEYGSSSEGTLQLSGNGQYLTIMGYGTNANAYNSGFDVNGSGTALAQSPNTGLGGANISRVIALIGANGSINTTTAITGVYSENNPRSVYTQNGTSFYISGQGNKDLTGGVFYVSHLGANTATAITGADTSSKSSGTFNQDTRDVQIVNGQLTVSLDSTEGTASKGLNIDRIGTLTATGGGLPTTALNQQPVALAGINGAVTLSNGNGNSINHSSGSAYLSPENFFYANATTLYVADSGEPKNGSSSGTLGVQNPGDGGLQKWSLVGGSWQLDYTLSGGLNLVQNDDDQNIANQHGVSGLYGLAGKVVGNTVELLATSYVLGDTDQTYLYGITDTLADTSASQASGESFTTLEAAPADSEFKGVSFAPSPVPLPPGLTLLLSGLAVIGLAGKMRRTAVR